MANNSHEVINRIRVWEEALRKSYSYLLSMNFKSIAVSEDQYIKYQVGERWANLHRELTVNSALLDASVIHFSSIFSSGKGGNKMARNTDNQVQKLRKDLIDKSLANLGWTNAEYDKLFDKIKAQRDGLLAHYSGILGDYKKETKGMSSRKMVGVHLTQEESEKLKKLLKVLLENTFNLAYLDNNT